MEKKRKFLFVSLSGLVGDIAWQVLKEGHEVRYFIGDPEEKDIADGFVPKTEDWEKDVDWADVIVFDDTLGQGEKAAGAAGAGQGGGRRHARTPTGWRTTARSARRSSRRPASTSSRTASSTTSTTRSQYVQENPSRYVIKPSGEAQNVKRRLFVGEEEDGGDVVRMLEAYKKAFSDEIKVFQLQKRVAGVEVAVGRLLQRQEFVDPININFEHKKLFPGNIGPSTGEMGTSMFWSAPNSSSTRRCTRWSRARRGGLRRLHRPQLHRERQRHLPARVHLALRLPDDLHPAGGDDHADRPVPRRPRRTAATRSSRSRAASRSACGSSCRPIPFDDDATFEAISKNAVDRLQEGRAGRGAHRGREDGERPVAGGGHLRRGAGGGRPGPDDEAGPGAGLRAASRTS